MISARHATKACLVLRSDVVTAQEAGVARRSILHIEVRRFQAFVFLEPRLEHGVQDSARQERALHRVGRLAGREEVFDPDRKGLQERGARRRREVEES